MKITNNVTFIALQPISTKNKCLNNTILTTLLNWVIAHPPTWKVDAKTMIEIGILKTSWTMAANFGYQN